MRTVFFAIVLVTLAGCGAQDQTSKIMETENPSMGRAQFNLISKSVSGAARAVSAALDIEDSTSRQKVVTKELLQRTQCIISVSIHRAAFLLGGNGGDGLMSCRLPHGGWGAPSFVRTGGFEFSAAFGYTVFNLAMFITDRALADSYKNQANFDVRAYVSAVAVNASAAILAADKYGMAVVQTNDLGLYAGAGVTFSSLSHMMAVRNQVVYQNVFSQETPRDPRGRSCASYLIRRRREACLEDWSRRTGHTVQTITARAILEKPADQAPQVTKSFNDMLRGL